MLVSEAVAELTSGVDTGNTYLTFVVILESLVIELAHFHSKEDVCLSLVRMVGSALIDTRANVSV
jgi:hypothetical protein